MEWQEPVNTAIVPATVNTGQTSKCRYLLDIQCHQITVHFITFCKVFLIVMPLFKYQFTYDTLHCILCLSAIKVTLFDQNLPKLAVHKICHYFVWKNAFPRFSEFSCNIQNYKFHWYYTRQNVQWKYLILQIFKLFSLKQLLGQNQT